MKQGRRLGDACDLIQLTQSTLFSLNGANTTATLAPNNKKMAIDKNGTMIGAWSGQIAQLDPLFANGAQSRHGGDRLIGGEAAKHYETTLVKKNRRIVYGTGVWIRETN